MMELANLPKVELHVHLDCCLSYAVVAQLDRSVSRAQYEAQFIAPRKCASLADFLTRASRGFQLMQTVEALRLVTEDLFEQLANDRVLYAEIRFAPLLHTSRGLSADRVVTAVDRATEACIRSTGVEARLILCTLRHFGEEQSLETARLVDRFRGSRVVALDLAGDEAAFPIEPHVAAFRYAMEHGLHRTAHAGEARGPESVWETLRHFCPARIGHGTRSVEDPKLVDHLRKQNIHLEVCPSSNVQTNACSAYEDHPVQQLFQAGVALGISTDSRAITNITLTEEYRRLQSCFGWTASELLACNLSSLKAAFVEEPVKQRLSARIHLPA